MSDRSPSPPTRRVIDIVAAIAATPEPMSVAAIADHLDIARATATAILAELDSAGWVRRDPSRGYGIGPTLAGLLGPALPPTLGDILTELTLRTGCGATLSHIEPDHLTVLDVRHGPERVVPGLPVGHRYPLQFPAGASVMPWRSAAEQNTWLTTAPDADRRVASALLTLVRDRGVALFRPRTDDAGTVELLADLLGAMSSALGQPHLRTRALRRLAFLTSRPFTKAELDSDAELPLSYLAAPVFDTTGQAAYEVQLGPLRASTTKSERDEFSTATIDTAHALTCALIP